MLNLLIGVIILVCLRVSFPSCMHASPIAMQSQASNPSMTTDISMWRMKLDIVSVGLHGPLWQSSFARIEVTIS